MECSSNFLCSVATIDSSICTIFNSKIKITESNTIYSSTATIYVKNFYGQINKYLIHYWPFNGNYVDVISNANLFNGSNDVLVADRFGRPSSSLYINYGVLKAPSRFYLYGDFTLTIWVKTDVIKPSTRFFVLVPANGNIVYFCLTSNQGLRPYYFYQDEQIANTSLSIGKWQHLAFTIQGSTLSIYIDGLIVYNRPTTPIPVRNYSTVYFGSYNGYHVNAFFDDFKIFNKSLSQTEIVESSLNNF